MLITSEINKNDDTQAIVIVKTRYFAPGVAHELDRVYLVTMDKITSRVTVQCEGATRSTRITFDSSDVADCEEKAALCVLHFPGA